MIGQLELAELLVAQALAAELGISLPERVAGIEETTKPQVEVTEGYSIGLYSLDEGALRRAQSVLEAHFPGVKVMLSHDKVATDALVDMARKCDLVVMAIASAKHAATNSIRSNRGNRPTVNAAGKGSSSLIGAVIAYVTKYVDDQAA